MIDGPLPLDVRDAIERALREDVRSGDVTSRAVIDAGARGRGEIEAREPVVACGLEVASACFESLDPRVSFEKVVAEGDRVEPGGVLARVEGPLRSLLAAERVALNFLQRACGIATATREVVDLVAGTGVSILDTRKTAPGLRCLDKHAVRTGGGRSHRHALDDMILVKDNHVAAAGSVAEATRRALAGAGHSLRVEVEVDSLEQLDELLGLPRLPDAVLLDNYRPADVAEAVRRIDGRMAVEVSGGITLANVRSFAEAGPDAISMGALTHSVRAADLALELES